MMICLRQHASSGCGANQAGPVTRTLFGAAISHRGRRIINRPVPLIVPGTPDQKVVMSVASVNLKADQPPEVAEYIDAQFHEAVATASL